MLYYFRQNCDDVSEISILQLQLNKKKLPIKQIKNR